MLHIVDAKAQKDGFLRPLVDVPILALLLGDPQRSAIERVERVLDGLARFARGGGGNRVARVPRGFDGDLKLGVGHGGRFLYQHWYQGRGRYSPRGPDRRNPRQPDAMRDENRKHPMRYSREDIETAQEVPDTPADPLPCLSAGLRRQGFSVPPGITPGAVAA